MPKMQLIKFYKMSKISTVKSCFNFTESRRLSVSS